MNRQKIIRDFEDAHTKKNPIKFNVGDTIDVHVKIVEEGKGRVQVFEGVVIKIQGQGARKTFTVRKISYGEGVERTFPINSPKIQKVTIMKKGRVRRSRLYYLRTKIGKKTKIEGEDVYEQQTTGQDEPSRKAGKA